jgi:hypothetical protein
LKGNEALFQTNIGDFVTKLDDFRTEIKNVEKDEQKEAEKRAVTKSPTKLSAKLKDKMSREDLKKVLS